MALFQSNFKYVLFSILNDWLQLADLGLTDSALCNKTLRENVLDLFLNYTVKVSSSSQINSVCFKWIVRKNVFPTHLLITEEDFVLLFDKLSLNSNRGQLIHLQQLHILGKRELEYWELPAADDECISVQLTDSDLEMFFEIVPDIKVLKLENLLKITDRVLESIAIHCDQLDTLEIISCKSMSGDGVMSISSKCKQLKHLTVLQPRNTSDWRVFVNEASGDELIRNLSALETFHTGGVRMNDAAIKNICATFKSLTSYSCPLHTFGATMELRQQSVMRMVSSFPRLTYIDISSMSTRHKWDVDTAPRVLRLLCDTCKDLRGINISSIEGLTTECIEMISKTYPSLLKLNIAYNERAVTAELIEKICARNTDLREFNVSACDLQLSSITHIAERLKKLEVLVAKQLDAKCYNFDYSYAVMRALPCLTRLHLEYQTRRNLEGLKGVALMFASRHGPCYDFMFTEHKTLDVLRDTKCGHGLGFNITLINGVIKGVVMSQRVISTTTVC